MVSHSIALLTANSSTPARSTKSISSPSPATTVPLWDLRYIALRCRSKPATCACPFRSWDLLTTTPESHRPSTNIPAGYPVTDFAALDATCEAAAKLIAQGRVIAWYRGRMEYGPRALGNRSILADPGHPAMRDRINAMVKMREAFRPFAPACSVEQAPCWFNVPQGTHMPYMITVVDVRPEHRQSLPAITHVNGSARLQTVSAQDNPDFHGLLKAVGKTTGREMVLNTSFNVKGQPIVNTPEEAIDTFLGTGIEFLFLENRLVARQNT